MASELIRCGHCGQKNRVPAAAAGTPRCGKCHQPLPWIADADDTTFGDVAEAAKIPVIVDVSPQVSRRFGAQAIPTLLVLRDGRVAAGRLAPPPWQPCGPGSRTRSPQPVPEHCYAPSAPQTAEPRQCSPIA